MLNHTSVVVSSISWFSKILPLSSIKCGCLICGGSCGTAVLHHEIEIFKLVNRELSDVI